jgi:hypothetical protein
MYTCSETRGTDVKGKRENIEQRISYKSQRKNFVHKLLNHAQKDVGNASKVTFQEYIKGEQTSQYQAKRTHTQLKSGRCKKLGHKNASFDTRDGQDERERRDKDIEVVFGTLVVVIADTGSGVECPIFGGFC